MTRHLFNLFTINDMSIENTAFLFTTCDSVDYRKGKKIKSNNMA